MLRQNFMRVLYVLIATGAVLTAYNAFIADNDPSGRVSRYLNLDIAVREQQETADSQVIIEDGQSSQTETDEESAPNTSTEQVQEPSEPTSNLESSAPAQESAPQTQATSGDKAQTLYTVKEGDTYGCIAERYYGSYEQWVDVVNNNPRTEGFTEYELHVGAQIVLPAITGTNLKPASSLCS